MGRRPKPTRLNLHRRVKREQWSTLAGAQLLERNGLPEDSPRRRPTLPKLRFLEREEPRS
jgi:hypothetical protein